MKKYISDWTVKENVCTHTCCLLKLRLDEEEQTIFPDFIPGQFVQVLVENSPSTFLRRPISVHFADKSKRELWLLIQAIGEGTRKLSELKPGEKLNLIYPLGRGFTVPKKNENIDLQINSDKKLLLIGGGVGVAPLFYLACCLLKSGYRPDFLFGARSKDHFFNIQAFEKIGKLYLTTEDGTCGEKGFVTQHSILKSTKYDFVYTCGPKPMMQAVAKYARQNDIPCEVSLENTMACGIGVCLCCVEKTKKGNSCVCTEGPVFNINQLLWQI